MTTLNVSSESSFGYIVDSLLERYSLDACDVLVFYSHAFGHQVTVLDSLNRLSSSVKGICAIIIADSRFNHLLLECFPHIRCVVVQAPRDLDIISCHSFAKRASADIKLHPRVRASYYQESYYEYLRSFTQSDTSYHIGDADSDRIIYRMQTPAEILIQQGVGDRLRLPEYRLEECRSLLRQSIFAQAFDRHKLVYIHTRMKTSNALSCRLRSVDNYTSYKLLLHELVKLGCHVVVGGDCPKTADLIEHHSVRYLTSIDPTITSKLLNLYLLSESCMVVTHQSGPTYVAGSAGVPQFITNAFPQCLGTLGKIDVNLYKKTLINNSILPYELAANEPKFSKLHFGLVNRPGISVVDNTEDEIIDAFSLFHDNIKSGSLDALVFKRQNSILRDLHADSPIKLHNSIIANIMSDI